MLNRKEELENKSENEPEKTVSVRSKRKLNAPKKSKRDKRQEKMVDENTGEPVEGGGLGTITRHAYEMRLFRKRKKEQLKALNKKSLASSAATANEQPVSSAAAIAAIPAELESSAVPAVVAVAEDLNEQPASSAPLANEIADPFVAVTKKLNYIAQISWQLILKINSNELQPRAVDRLNSVLVDLKKFMDEFLASMNELASSQPNPSLTPELENQLNAWVEYLDRILAQQVQEANQAQQAELQARQQLEAYQAQQAELQARQQLEAYQAQQAYELQQAELQARQRQVQQAQQEQKAELGSSAMPVVAVAVALNEQPASSAPLANEIAYPFMAVSKKINHITQIATQLTNKINSKKLQLQVANQLNSVLDDLEVFLDEFLVSMDELASSQLNPSLTPELEAQLNLWVEYLDRILAQSSAPFANEIAYPFIAVAKKISHITQIATQLMSKINSEELQPRVVNRLNAVLGDWKLFLGEFHASMHELVSSQHNPSLRSELEDPLNNAWVKYNQLNAWFKYLNLILARQQQEANQAAQQAELQARQQQEANQAAQQAELQARRQQEAYQAYQAYQLRQARQAQHEKQIVEAFLESQDEEPGKRQKRS